ncbi:MerR family transcriptional regulator [Eggerthella guodeyinii]|uniref:MerR family transcriptional regulator n=1 Tax=Eggerthella guodeyinii TaxID=2690837 RepID=A0A6L7ITS2_9ACTN|nr:MerR family transcriptional regulator [Eggerthella guodeyinii]QOS66746.1 MerR family transcriptional regulator [Eggerthella guodeyinii]
MLYTIGDAAKKLGMSATTLRYYDKEGLLPYVNRSGGGMRMFTEDDFEWVRFIECLKRSGLTIKEIKRFVDWYLEGDGTIGQRRDLFHARKRALEEEMADLQRTLDFVSYKCWFYDVAAEAGTTDAPHAIKDEDLPPEIRDLKARSGANKY